MNQTTLAIGLIALFAGAAWLAIWSRADTRGRAMAMVLFAVGIPTTALATVEMLGHARPLKLEWHLEGDREYLILAAKMVQDVGIWLYLDTGEHEPRSLVLPWDNKTANDIQRALDGAPEGAEGQFIMRYDQSLATEFSAHALPQRPEPPAKDEPDQGLTYQQ